MRKILIYDHKFNVESISACSQIDKSIIFFDRVKTLSFYDNFDKIKPDELWINSFVCPKDFLHNVKQNVKIKVVDYNISHILPNIFATADNNTTNSNISCILQNESPTIGKIYKYEQYIKFYTINNHQINHAQYCGTIDSCKDLTNVICSSDKILFDDDMFKSIALFYNKPNSRFKQGGTISWSLEPFELLTNRDLFFQYASK